MGGQLRVDTGVLRASAAHLASQATAFEGATASTLAPGAGSYGSSALVRATQQFADRWAVGLTYLATDLRAAGATLDQVAGSYEYADAALADAARQMLR